MSEALQENFIQKVALNFLSENHYRSCGKGLPYAKMEEYTIKGYRADGVVAFVHRRDKIYVASLEAKSSKTVANLIAEIDESKVFIGSYWLSFAVITIGAIFLYRSFPPQILEPLWAIAIGLLLYTFLVGFTWLFRQFSIGIFMSVGVLKQLHKYPANERWVAIGEDSLQGNDIYRKLRNRCRRAGVGLIIVKANERVDIELHPTPRSEPFKQDFLAHYKKGDAIRSDLLNKSGKGFWKTRLTPAQSNQRLQKVIWLVAFAVFVPLVLGSLGKPNRPIINEYEFGTTNPAYPQEPIHEEPVVRELPAEIRPKEKSDCKVKKKLKGNNYILKDSFWEHEADAEKRVRQLINDGFGQADYLWLPCYRSSILEESFCVYIYSPEKNEEKVQFHLRRFREIAFSEELVIYKPEVLEVEYRE